MSRRRNRPKRRHTFQRGRLVVRAKESTSRYSLEADVNFDLSLHVPLRLSYRTVRRSIATATLVLMGWAAGAAHLWLPRILFK